MSSFGNAACKIDMSDMNEGSDGLLTAEQVGW